MTSLAETVEEALKYTDLPPVGGSDDDLRPLAHLLTDAVMQWLTLNPNRPVFPPHAGSVERDVVGDGRKLTLRQVGWHGQSGALYGYGEPVGKSQEPGSFSPVWVVAHADRVEAEPAPTKADLDSAYRERAELVAHLAARYPSLIAQDPGNPEWQIVYIDVPEGQLSWHVAPGDLELFGHVGRSALPAAELWDGHGTAQKYARLRSATMRVDREQRGV